MVAPGQSPQCFKSGRVNVSDVKSAHGETIVLAQPICNHRGQALRDGKDYGFHNVASSRLASSSGGR